MYESPIKIYELTRDIQQNIKQDQEEKVMECICEYGISIDKEELIKALEYDRNQYEKGFADAIDKIRAEIGKSKTEHEMQIAEKDIKAKLLISDIYCDIVNILDKYKAESEG